jgi:hypothetical protein
VQALYRQQREALTEEIAELELMAAEARSVDAVDRRFARRLFEALLAQKHQQRK